MPATASAITACHQKYRAAERPAPQGRSASVSIRDLESSQPLTAAVPVKQNSEGSTMHTARDRWARK
jgi:hypothetical protein